MGTEMSNKNRISEADMTTLLVNGDLDVLLREVAVVADDASKDDIYYKTMSYIINEIGSDSQILAGLSTAIKENNSNKTVIKEIASYLALDGVERRLASGDFDQARALMIMYLSIIGLKISSEKLVVYPILNFCEYVKKNDVKIYASLNESKANIKINVYSNEKKSIEEKTQKMEVSPSSVCEIKNVVTRGGGGALIIPRDNIIVSELASGKNFNNYSLRKDSILSHYNNFGILDKFEVTTEAGECINTCGADSQNYYHFIFGVISKIIMADHYNVESRIPLLLDGKVPHISQYREAITIANRNKRSFMSAPYGFGLHIKSMIYAPSACLFPANLKRGRMKDENGVSDYAINIEIIKLIREYFFEHANITPSRKIKIFCKRPINSTIRCLNEDIIAEYFLSIGFDIVSPEKMSFVEQIKMFSQCDVFAGVGGAAFTNVIFMPEGARAICLTDSLSLGHAVPAQAAGVNFFQIIGSNINKISHYSNPFTVSIDNIKSAVSMM